MKIEELKSNERQGERESSGDFLWEIGETGDCGFGGDSPSGEKGEGGLEEGETREEDECEETEGEEAEAFKSRSLFLLSSISFFRDEGIFGGPKKFNSPLQVLTCHFGFFSEILGWPPKKLNVLGQALFLD